MSELADLVAVFGAVDEAVVKDRKLLPTVAALVPAYAEGAAGWFTGIRTWSDLAVEFRRSEGEERDVEPLGVGQLPTVVEALDNLSEGAGTDHLVTRRLLAITLLSRVRAASAPVPPGTSPDSSALAVTDADLAGALEPVVDHPDYLGTWNPETRAVRLVAILQNAHDYPVIGSWGAMMQKALSENLISQSVADRSMSPMGFTVIPTTPGGGPAVAFETRTLVDVPAAVGMAAARDQVADILDPSRWTNVDPPWCAMRWAAPAPTLGVTPWSGRCLEVINVDCTGVPPLVPLNTVLDFRCSDLGDGSGSVLEYRLVDNQPAVGGDGLVTVDEGSLVVHQVGTTVEVITTKRVQFHAFSGMSPLEAAGLAWFVWIVGYNSNAESFIEKVAGVSPSRLHPVGSHRGGAGANPGGSAAGAGQPGTGAPQVDQLVAGMEKIFDECVQDLRTSMSKVTAGSYGPTTYLGDAAKLSNHLVRHGTLLAKFWADVLPGSVRAGASDL